MNCQFCGRDLGLVSVATGDRDFCSARHRNDFNKRLSKGLALLAEESYVSGKVRSAGAFPMMRICSFMSEASVSDAMDYTYTHRICEPGMSVALDPEALLREVAELKNRVAVTESRAATQLIPQVASASARKPVVVNIRDRQSSRGCATIADKVTELLSRVDQLRSDMECAAALPNRFATA